MHEPIHEIETVLRERLDSDMLNSTIGIAFDDCHKIYMITRDIWDWSYPIQIEIDESNRDTIIPTLAQWFSESCGLRFINYVTDHNSNAGYHNVISQFDEAFDEEEEEEDDWFYDEEEEDEDVW